jgi:hypothetical protein
LERFPSHIIISYQGIPDWSANKSDKDKCTLERYQEDVVSKDTIMRKYNTQLWENTIHNYEKIQYTIMRKYNTQLWENTIHNYEKIQYTNSLYYQY